MDYQLSKYYGHVELVAIAHPYFANRIITETVQYQLVSATTEVKSNYKKQPVSVIISEKTLFLEQPTSNVYSKQWNHFYVTREQLTEVLT